MEDLECGYCCPTGMQHEVFCRFYRPLCRYCEPAGVEPYVEHEVGCPLRVPPLTSAEILRVRQLLGAVTTIVGLSQGPDGEPLYPHVVARPMKHSAGDLGKGSEKSGLEPTPADWRGLLAHDRMMARPDPCPDEWDTDDD